MLAPKDIPDLQFRHATDTKEKGDSPEKTDVMEIMDVNIEDSVTVPQNSDFRGTFKKFAGKCKQVKHRSEVSEQRSVKQDDWTQNCTVMPANTENILKNRRIVENRTDVETPRKLVKRTFSRDTHLQHSESREHSQNSRIKQAGVMEVTASAEDAEHTAASSDFSKTFSKLAVEVVNAKVDNRRGERCLLVIVTVSVQ